MFDDDDQVQIASLFDDDDGGSGTVYGPQPGGCVWQVALGPRQHPHGGGLYRATVSFVGGAGHG